MKHPANNTEKTLFTDSGAALTRRMLRVMSLATLLAASVSTLVGNWRVTVGLLLGGILALLNHYWLQTSIGAAFARAAGTRPKIQMAQYVLRYFVIGISVYIAYKLNLVSLPATVIGLSTFVIALFAEAFREFYLSIIHREEIN